MPVQDICITSIFEPGFIGSSIGTTPTVIVFGSLYTPLTYNPNTVVYSHDFSKFYNGFVQHHRAR